MSDPIVVHALALWRATDPTDAQAVQRVVDVLIARERTAYLTMADYVRIVFETVRAAPLTPSPERTDP